jgi:5,10-methylenetetrahydromethanopterin reductase
VAISMGVGLFPTESPARIRELTHLAEELGYDNVWFGDSQNIWREAYVNMAAAAVGTERITFGTGVTQAITRHPSVLASVWATLHELTGGRAICGIGTGDSSLRTMGLSPMKLAELEATVADLRALFAGEEVTEASSDAPFRLNYVDEPRDVPIYIAASAPKITELTGRIADGVILLVGTDPRFVEAGLERLERGAKASGRTLDDLHIVLWTPTAIYPDPAVARDLVRAHVARVIIRPLPAELPADKMDQVTQLRDSYDYYHHLDTAAGHADLVPDDLIPHFALAGTPDECATTVEKLSALPIDQIAIVPFTPPGGDRGETMREFARIAGTVSVGV